MMGNKTSMFENYYQLAQPLDKLDEVISAINKQNIPLIKLRINKRFLLALKIRSFFDLDEKIRNVNIKYFPIRNINFENLLRLSKKVGLQVRRIDIEKIEDDKTREEFEQAKELALSSKKYSMIINLMKKLNVIIKRIDISDSLSIVTIYESGIVWTCEDLILSNKIKSFLQKVLKNALLMR